jgi:hypothetical protein
VIVQARIPGAAQHESVALQNRDRLKLRVVTIPDQRRTAIALRRVREKPSCAMGIPSSTLTTGGGFRLAQPILQTSLNRKRSAV